MKVKQIIEPTPQIPSIQRVKHWIIENPLHAFFLIGITISFSTLFPALIFISHNNSSGQLLSFYLGKIGVYSPVLTGILIERIICPKKSTTPTRNIPVTLLIWLISVIILIASLSQTAPPDLPLVTLILISIPAALLPAYVVSSAISGTEGVKKMLETLIKPKGKIRYYLIALITFPIIHPAGTVITNILDGNTLLPQISQIKDVTLTFLITFFSVLLYSGGINEESGWRGFAQKRMQAKYSPLISNLILWFLMVIWHIPNDIIQYQHGNYIFIRFVLYPCIAVLFGWVYNRTNGSILAPAIFHASMNSMNPLVNLFPVTYAGSILLITLTVIVVISSQMWRKLPEQHDARAPRTQLSHGYFG
jgi:membrane protease YdiL (CAAX protease family)